MAYGKAYGVRKLNGPPKPEVPWWLGIAMFLGVCAIVAMLRLTGCMGPG